MGLNCGIIGLPNVGKSTIFNALSGAGAQMANYPFCTIEPNKGIVPVPDERLKKIGEILDKKNYIMTRVEFIDVAGLVKGASKGEGLGNKFLGHIRNVDALIHVVRCFSSEDVVHVTGDIDPVRDIEIINTELILADIEVLERGKERLIKMIRSGDKHAPGRVAVLERIINHLNEGKPLSTLALHDEEKAELQEYGLITNKPVLYLANSDESGGGEKHLDAVRNYAREHGSGCVPLIGKLEEEISELSPDEKQEYLSAMGLNESGLDRLTHEAYRLLDLLTYYTAATELQAWTIKRGTAAVKAAGKIHTDFERGFIRAEVYNFKDLAAYGSEHAVKEKGLYKSEGKEYIIQEGDIVKYLFNV